MREDLVCEVRGRVVTKGKKAATGFIEFLPEFPYFCNNDIYYTPLGGRRVLDDNGCFSVLLTRSDRSRIRYIVNGAAGRYMISVNGPGPHNFKELLEHATRLGPAVA